MPHLIEVLGNVKECSRAVLLGIKGCVDCGMLLPEAKLIIGDETVGGH
jgi:hypothetical protein